MQNDNIKNNQLTDTAGDEAESSLDKSKEKLFQLVANSTRFEREDLQIGEGSQNIHNFFVYEEYSLTSKSKVGFITGKSKLASNTLAVPAPSLAAIQEAESKLSELIQHIVDQYDKDGVSNYGRQSGEITLLTLEQEYSHLDDCHVCNSLGKTVCGVCSGAAYFTCSSCGGAGNQSCYACNGGWRTCSSCGGRGSVQQVRYHNNVPHYTEQHCYGCTNGQVRCGSCGGTTRIVCRTCGGSGKTACTGCAGNGWIDCSTCETSGKVGEASNGYVVANISQSLQLSEGIPSNLASCLVEREGAIGLPAIAEKFTLRESPTVNANSIIAYFDGSVVDCQYEVKAVGKSFSIEIYGNKQQWLSLSGLIESLLEADLVSLRQMVLGAHLESIFSVNPEALLDRLRLAMSSEINVAIMETPLSEEEHIFVGVDKVPIRAEYAREIKVAALGAASTALFRRSKFLGICGASGAVVVALIAGLIWGMWAAASTALVVIAVMLPLQIFDANRMFSGVMKPDIAKRLLQLLAEGSQIFKPRGMAMFPGILVVFLVSLGFSQTSWNEMRSEAVDRGQTNYMASVEQSNSKISDAAQKTGKVYELAELKSMGEKVYADNCVGCHRGRGQGAISTFPDFNGSPALDGSAIVNGPKEAQINIVMNGKSGTTMPAFVNILSDTDISAVVTYTRNAWNNHADGKL